LLVLAQPGRPPNTTPTWQLVAVGLVARLLGAPKHNLGAPRLGWAMAPNMEGWPKILRLWLAMAWILGRAG
jgi:hypothetical protein